MAAGDSVVNSGGQLGDRNWLVGWLVPGLHPHTKVNTGAYWLMNGLGDDLTDQFILMMGVSQPTALVD